ncbi:MAG: TetR/AcrR family transcriptional regulator [Spirochaetes bacterium]|nr:TetR/AcrR family transcriptional regulator [Spirochaetota bacterium]
MKKNLIKNAAEGLFERYGYQKVTIDEIVQSARVAKGTFYLYFKNKDDLYRQIVQNYYQTEMPEMINKYIAGEKDLRTRLFEDFIGGLIYLNQRKILKEIILQNSNYFSESINFEIFLDQTSDYIKTIFAEDLSQLRLDITVEQFARMYMLQYFAIFQEKNKDNFWNQAECHARVFIDGILSNHKWEGTSIDKIIEKVKKL